MNILNMSQLTKSYTGDIIFEDLKFDLNDGDRVGLVGRNGEGKTTLLKLMAGTELPTEGYISWQKDITIGLLDQIPEYDDEVTVYECLTESFEKVNSIEQQMSVLEYKMSEDPDNLESLLKQYGELLEDYEKHDGYSKDAQIRRIAHGLKINELLNQQWHFLSGGERTKVGLAQILLHRPKLLLLDEPTNHLDIFSIDWLMGFIKSYEGAVVIISHDRYFLDNTVNQIIEIDQSKLYVYHGNYSYFVDEKEKRILQEFESYQNQQKKIRRMEASIKQLRLWASQAKPPNAAMYRRAKSMEKALNRIRRLEKPVMESDKMHIDLKESKRVSNDVVEMTEVSKMYETILFEKIDMLVQRKENISIIGENGTGKTTLLKILQGEVEPDYGKVKLVPNSKVGYLSQNPFEGSEDMRVMDKFREDLLVTEGTARHKLAQFMFYGMDVFKRISSLSGGEKMRLRWAQIVNQEFNVLILDEPTNHLDIDAKETVEDALLDYEGTIIAVSHDRYFLNKIFNVTYLLDDKKLIRYEGNYDYFKEKFDG